MRDYLPIKGAEEKQTEVVQREVIRPTILPLESGILDILSQHVGSYVLLNHLVSTHYLIPSALLTAKGLDMLNRSFNQDSNLLLEAITFADTVALLDISRGGVGSEIFNDIGLIASKNRKTRFGAESFINTEEANPSRGRNTISRNTTKMSFNIEDFEHDTLLMSVYLYCLVCNLYKKYTIDEKDVK